MCKLTQSHLDYNNNVSLDVWGFEDENITVLMDDGVHTSPTRDNILNAYRTLVSESKPGDVAFCHYSGHGGKLRDDDGDESK